MALRMKTVLLGSDATLDCKEARLFLHDSFGESQDPLSRITLNAFYGLYSPFSDDFPEEKAVFGLGRIGMKFRQNHRGAK